jgi:hypothetical protein
MIIHPEDQRIVDIIDKRDTMYPTYAVMARTAHVVPAREIGWATLFGYSFGNTTITVGEEEYNLEKHQYFSIPVHNEDVGLYCYSSDIFAVFRLGFIGQNIVGKQNIKAPGKLSYIDGCSDTLIIYPPRLGDPSLNYLHFPENINQSYHTHPSIRIGCVIDGFGISDTTEPLELLPGTFFCLDEHELHRFRTAGSTMKIIAFHPDGDWGPTDENHTMLNRTYVNR